MNRNWRYRLTLTFFGLTNKYIQSVYEEIFSLKKLKVIVTLGKVAFDNCTNIYKKKYQSKKKYIFRHGEIQDLPNGLIILPSYHPSPRNVNTKLVNEKMMTELFKKARSLAKF